MFDKFSLFMLYLSTESTRVRCLARSCAETNTKHTIYLHSRVSFSPRTKVDVINAGTEAIVEMPQNSDNDVTSLSLFTYVCNNYFIKW